MMEPRLSWFGSSIAWLLRREVSASRLAFLFNTSPENIRVVAFRARHASGGSGPSREPPLDEPPTAGLAKSLGIRAVPDEVVRTPQRTRKLESLLEQIDEIVARHSAAYTFLEAFQALHALLPLIGHPADTRRIALAASLHQHMAWFLVHSGRADSATTEAETARGLWRIAYHQSPKRGYAHDFTKSALIGAQAGILSRQPKQTLQLLDLAEDSSRYVSAPMGSEHLRQRGAALFQLKEDDVAKKCFHKAAVAMEKYNEASHPAQILLTGARHINLIGNPQWEDAQELAVMARSELGEHSIEASIAVNWAAACGLSTDSQAIHSAAATLLKPSITQQAQFGHQATIRKLLALTPDLGLDARLRRDWVRRSLYENAFRTR